MRKSCLCLMALSVWAALVNAANATGAVTVSSAGRCAFVRAETNAVYGVAISNATERQLSGLRLEACQVTQGGVNAARFGSELGVLPARTVVTVNVPVETRLRPGSFLIDLKVTGAGSEGLFAERMTLAGAIGPTFADRMPVVMWGCPILEIGEFGFTHGTVLEIGHYERQDKPDCEARAIELLDQCVTTGVRLVKYEKLCYPQGKIDGYYRRTRTGQNWMKNKKRPAPEVSHPKMLEAMKARAESNVKLMGSHPGLGGLLAVSEARDHAFPSFNTEHLRYKAETGLDVPAEISKRFLELDASRRRFADGVVPEDDPVLRYLNWFWRGGDGWPAYCSAIADIYHRDVKRPDFFSFWDPSVRCPPLWCAPKGVGYLNQWVYAAPDPMNVAGPLEEELAMAGGTPGQQTMMMTQIICYRNSLAPTSVTVPSVPSWYARRPEARFLTIPPDTLTEAVWSMLAKPVKGIMFHGWGSLKETGEQTGYCLTNGETSERMRSLLRDVVAPLGPMLKRLGRKPSPVAVLESSTSALLGAPHGSGWSAPAVTFLQRARLDPRVVYEDTLRRDGFAGIKVLFAPQLQFASSSLVDALKKFQQEGGILVGDQDMLSSLKPDIVVPVATFNPPELDDSESFDANESRRSADTNRHRATKYAKAKMQRDGETLRAELSARGYVPSADSSSPEIVVYSRQFGTVPYLFALNDKRTFGDYVGQWGCSMERGLPFAGSVSLAVKDNAVGAVYELSRGGEVPFELVGGKVCVPLEYTTNDGRVLAFLPKKIAKVALEVPEKVARGARVAGCVRVNDADGMPVPALLPVEISVFDAQGRELDGAGAACAEDGVARLDLTLNLDDPNGTYTVWCRDRASGLTAEKKIVCEGL